VLETRQAKIYTCARQKAMGPAGAFLMEWKRWGQAFGILRDLSHLSYIT